MSNKESESDAQLLQTLLTNELTNIPLSHWGYFYPCHVAVWRFIEHKRPNVLGTLSSGYDTEPYYRGKGAEWFCETLGNAEDYLDAVEKIMYAVVDSLSPATKERGYLLDEESPVFDSTSVRALATVVLAEADKLEE